MHIAIDILVGIVLLFFFLSGWHKGALLSLLGVARVVLSYGVAYLSGRYLGYWIGAATHRPRLVTIPAVAIITFALIAFTFHIVMHNIRAHHKEKEKKENFQLPILSCLSGGAINLAAGTISLALLFWLSDLFMVGVAGTPIPGAGNSNFGRFARRMVYEVSYSTIPKQDNKTQVAAMARMISNPGLGLEHMENILAADSMQHVLTDKELAKDLLSGDADRIAQNASLQRLFNDRATLDELRELGVVSGYETKSGLCKKLATFGQNETIHSSIERLQTKQLLSTDKITLLIRDPDFDTIVAELVK
ncbi:MAG: CvpA family protein [Verrucomicrobia bacterium]|nr:CvpA family protein [Verrucomicrobiota bacterium]